MFKKIFLFIVFLGFASLAFSQEFPEKSNTLVTDYTNTLSAGDKQALESKLVAFNDSTSTQIAVVLIKSVGDYDIGEYGTQLGRKWGIGEKGKNNGVLILAAINDRKITIQTGYGAEGPVPDAVTSQIIENDIKPHFKTGDYYGGLDAATSEIISRMKGEYKADPRAQHRSTGSSAGIIVIIVIFILIFIFRNRGGGGHIIGGRGGASPFWWFLAGNLLGSSSSRGSDWGGFSGGDSGGGGFGGFGGGSFGGGGSSGSW